MAARMRMRGAIFDIRHFGMDWMGHRSMSANDPTASKHIKGAEEGGINLANYISAGLIWAILQETLHIGTFFWQ